jgi:hypothetical protein
MKDKELREIVCKSFDEIEKALNELEKAIEKIEKKENIDLGLPIILWSKPWRELRKCKCTY